MVDSLIHLILQEVQDIINISTLICSLEFIIGIYLSM